MLKWLVQSTMQYVRCSSRACHKIHSHHLHAPLSAIFAPNSVNIARFWHKSPTEWVIHLAESIFKTYSRLAEIFLLRGNISDRRGQQAS